MSALRIADRDGDWLEADTEKNTFRPEVIASIETRENVVELTREDAASLRDWLAARLAETEPSMGLKVGDKVTVTGPSYWTNGTPSGSPAPVGTRGVIVDEFDDGDVTVEWIEGGHWTVIAAASLSPVEEPEPFKVGETLIVMGNDPSNPAGEHSLVVGGHFEFERLAADGVLWGRGLDRYGLTPLTQGLLASDLTRAKDLPLDKSRPGDEFPNVAYVRQFLGREVRP